MPVTNSRRRFQTVGAIALLSLLTLLWTRSPLASAAPVVPNPTQLGFDKYVKPFFAANCIVCHNTDTAVAGVRVDQLDASFEDRQVRVWELIRKRVGESTMPPEGMPQPTAEERKQVVDWITQGIEMARLRPAPKNGLARRLTIAQYRNTLKELLQLDDDLTTGLPPDAISKDGFVNNQETLNLSTMLLESYFDIADQALSRAIIDPKTKPAIQDFKVELGASVNPNPFPDPLILGDGSRLLDNKDVLVTQPIPVKPFPFEPHPMKTNYRFIEGYQGNDTVRGWREYDSIYHAVYADMRGTNGYPKGVAYSTVPQGLLLRPAIPNDEVFGADGTFGPRANFKVSVRELPETGRFRVTVMAARYNDGLMLDTGDQAVANAQEALVVRNPATPQTVTVPKPGIYQVDVRATDVPAVPAPDPTHLTEGLSASWSLDGNTANIVGQEETASLVGSAQFVESPFGKALSLPDDKAGMVISHRDAMNVGAGDFTISAWIHPKELRKSGLVSIGADGMTGWYLESSDVRGSLRLVTTGPDGKANGTVTARPGVIRPDAWQHIVAVVHRGTGSKDNPKNETRLYVDGYLVARGEVGPANLDNPKMSLTLGRTGNAQRFHGEMDEVRLYRRALADAEVQALVEPGRKFAQAPPAEKPQLVTLHMGDREFAGTLQAAFLAVRLDGGPLALSAQYAGLADLDQIVLAPLAETNDIAKRFLAFEKRAPHLGVHMGFRRDCGSTFAQVGSSQDVTSDKLMPFVFEGSIKNYPNPDVDKENYNYLAGVHEIGVRSEYTDGRDMPRLVIRSVEFEGPFYDKWPAQSYTNIFIDSPHKGETPAYAEEVIKSFATRAYRRPATAAEVSALMDVYRKASAGGRNFQDSVKDALQVVLTSPQFLFLVENSHSPAAEPIDNYELSSKLSYFLWNGPPDSTTLKLAANGSLRKQLDSEVDRLMQDPRFSRFTREFTYQWLYLDKFAVLEPDKKKFPNLTAFARSQLREEPIQFVDYLIRNNMPVKNLIDADFIMANETVAGYYDLSEKINSGFQFVPIAPGHREIGGVLTEAAIMAGLSDGRESNPVKRGAWVARRIIYEPPADPPPNVPVLKEDTAKTLRQRLEQHRNQPGCLQCHAKIDPWGVALEEFDADGRLKSKTADAHSILPDKTEVSGINDLKHYLTNDRIDQIAFSFLRNLETYGTGRTLTYSELDTMKREQLKMKADGYRMKDLIHYVVNSRPFLEK